MKKSLSVLAIMFLAAIMIAFTDAKTITGKVTDNQGQAIPGVIVKLKGSNSSSATPVTDMNGNYKIVVDQKAKVLVFSFIGYTTKEEIIGDRTIVNVVITEDVSSLQEVVVTGYSSRNDMASKSVSMAAPSAMGYGSKRSFQRYNNNFNTEGYSPINENGFKNVKIAPLSTFSIDVDNASYTNIRRFINMGELPPADAVRIEEMINYFKYQYPEPTGEHPFSVYTELAQCPWNKKHQLLQIGLRGKSIDKSALPPSNLVFLIDVSGSMSDPNKLPLLKSAFNLLVNELRAQDRVAIVVYAGAAGLVLESTPGNRKETILSAIDNLEAGGSTAGGAGLKLAYSEAEKNFIKGGNNRIILATDGDFNVGESGNGGMERLVEEKRELGVFITVLGFGMGNVKDDKMETIADKGNGNYSYIDNLQEARKVLVREFGGTLFTIAKDVKFQIEFNPAKVKSYRLVGYENRLLNDEDFNDDTKDAGEMGAGHNVTALYEIVPAGSDEKIPVIDPLKYQPEPIAAGPRMPLSDSPREMCNIKLRYKQPDGLTSKMFEKTVGLEKKAVAETSDRFRFSAAVASFGMILRNSPYKGSASVSDVVSLASGARSSDPDGYRAEFIRLVQSTNERVFPQLR